MKPENIDKLFGERLGKLERTPSADAWQRLQEQLQPPQKNKVIPMWWSIAATLAFLVLTGTYLYFNQLYTQTGRPVAQVEQPNRQEQQAIPGQPSSPSVASTQEEPQPEQLAIKEQGNKNSAGTQTTEVTTTPAAPALAAAQPARTPAAAPDQEVQKQVGRKETPAKVPSLPEAEPVQVARNEPRIELKEAKELPVVAKAAAPAAATATKTAPETIEVVIVKDDGDNELLAAAGEMGQPEERTGSRKGKLVRGLLKQVKNIAAGEKVDLAEIGINRYSIALETQIGNRKISKTINL